MRRGGFEEELEKGDGVREEEKHAVAMHRRFSSTSRSFASGKSLQLPFLRFPRCPRFPQRCHHFHLSPSARNRFELDNDGYRNLG